MSAQPTPSFLRLSNRASYVCASLCLETSMIGDSSTLTLKGCSGNLGRDLSIRESTILEAKSLIEADLIYFI